VRDFVVDREHKIVSTPAYMLAERISEVAEGVDRAVEALLALIG
jgi:enhancing lycopene biosynthesis protein 2